MQFNPDDYADSPVTLTKEALLRAFRWNLVEEEEEKTRRFLWANVSFALERLEVQNDKRASEQI